MDKRSKQMTIGAAVIATITLLGYVGDAADVWGRWGWKPRATVDAEITALRAETVGGIKEFRDEWKCDEYDEELRDLLREQQQRRDAGLPEDTDLNEDIRQLRDKMDKLNCSRFEI